MSNVHGCGSPNCLISTPTKSISHNAECTCLDGIDPAIKYKVISAIYRREHEIVQLRAQINELTQRVVSAMGKVDPHTPNIVDMSCETCVYGCFLKGPAILDGTCTHHTKETFTQRNWRCDLHTNAVRSVDERYS